MAGVTTGVLSDVLKRLYLPKTREQINDEILVLQILSLNTEDIEGLEAVLSLHTGRSKGVGARREMADLPEAGSQKYKQATYDLAYLYGRIMVSGQAIAKTKSDAGSWIRAMRDELDRIRNDLALDFARQVYGTGDGVIAEVDSVVAGAGSDPDTVVLTSDEVLQKGYIYGGMELDFGDVLTPHASGQQLEVLDVDVDGPSFTIAHGTASGISGGDKVFRFGSNDADGTAEMTAGIQSLVSDDPTSSLEIGGIDQADNAFWRNAAKQFTGSAINLSDLMQEWNVVNARGAKATDIKVLTTPGLTRRLFESEDFAERIQFVNTQQMQGGFENISFAAGGGRMNIYTDRLAPYGKVHYLHSAHQQFFSPADWDFLARDGLTVKWVDNKDAFQSILFRYVNMGTDRRNTSAVLFDATDTGF